MALNYATTAHTHEWELTSETVPLHNYVKEGGNMIKDLIQGKDKLLQRKCRCGKTETYDLKRLARR